MNAMRLVIWSVAAAAAIGVTTTAVTVANATGGGRDDVLSQDDVSRELTQSGSPTTPPETGSPPAVNGESFTIERTAGRLVVACDGNQAWLTSWSPNPGYRVDEVTRGPAESVAVWFESDTDEDVEVIVTCQNGEPVVADLVEPDDHGGDRDDHDRDHRDGDDHDDDDHDDDDDDRSGSNRGHG
ncbi:MAG TPA: hypothetical protein VIL37_00055 [Natronosporangium sp.]